ncbi:hypothetical protein CVU37_12335 [candidate division BRC1 bacterium HGW-BRC1-1]|jgi:uncharacterized membrane protein|nr:MAG: hypothetical protein CVU37_12335 [candidate division BRC1 bacterium HGW-BRC1-1]
MARKKSTLTKVPLIAAELLGLGLSFYLILISLGLLHGGVAPCPRGGIFACHSILTGDFSKIGPIPIALLGVIYFSFSLVMTLIQQKRDFLFWIKGAALVASLFFVAYLRAIEILWMKAICVWCWAVAFAALAQVYFAVPHFTPPLPKLTWGVRLGALLGTFVLFFAVSLGVAMMLPVDTKHDRADRILKAATEATKAAPTQIAQPVATPVKNQSPAAVSTPQANATVTPAPAKPAAVSVAQYDFPENEMTPEHMELKDRGWRVVTSGKAVEQAMGGKPLLMLTFDSDCKECQALIHGALRGKALDSVDVQKFAIEGMLLRGTLSDLVHNVPTLMLFDTKGNVIFKHEGRMGEAELVRALNNALALGAGG